MAYNVDTICFDAFVDHWQQIMYSMEHDDDSINAEVISKHMDIITSLICNECEGNKESLYTIVRTDHSSLQWLRNFKEPEGQVARWLEFLQEYTFVVHHRKGLLHSNADALSRRPCYTESCKSCERKEEIWTIRRTTLEKEWKTSQVEDRDLNTIRQKLEEFSIQPTFSEMGSMTSCVLQLWKQWNSLAIKGGILMRKREKLLRETYQVIVPRKRRVEVMEEIHAGRTSGHFGVERTFRAVQQRFYWPGYRKSVDVFCAGCVPCLSRDHPGRNSVPPLGLRVVGYPFERIALDVMGPLKMTDRGNRYILVVGDYFTKWIEAYPIPNQEATTIAGVLCKEFICRYGVPNEIHSDQGRSFESSLFKDVCDLLGVKKTRTTSFRPQSDGMVERFNQTLVKILSKVVDKQQSDWDERLPYALLAYRTSTHSATGFQPCEVLMGLQLRLPIDLLVPLDDNCRTKYGEFVRGQEQYIAEIRDNVSWKLNEIGKKMKMAFDKKVHVLNLVEGDMVWVRNLKRTRGLSPKLQVHWNGPFEVLKVINDQLVKISRKGRPVVIHRAHLKKEHSQIDIAVEPS